MVKRITAPKSVAKKKDKVVAAPKKGLPVGRPSKYLPDHAESAYKLCLLGSTDAGMADIMGISEYTFHEWKKSHPEFSESITRGKAAADANVAERLYKRALGYEHPEVHVSNYQGEITLTPLTKHYPPDTQAASLWLRNRQPKKWRDKQDLEHSGPDGGPIALTMEQIAANPASRIKIGK